MHISPIAAATPPPPPRPVCGSASTLTSACAAASSPTARAAVSPRRATSPPPTEADQGLFGIKLPELPDISRLDELIPGNDKESKLRRLQESRKEAGAIDKDGAWLL